MNIPADSENLQEYQDSIQRIYRNIPAKATNSPASSDKHVENPMSLTYKIQIIDVRAF
jgi:hypothetical protein